MALTGINGLFANPQSAGMLGLAQGLLSASGPSRLPINLGAAMGAGVGGMRQGVQQAMQQQLAQQQLLSAAMQNKFMQGKLGMLGALMGGGAPAQSAAGVGLAPAVLAMGAKNDPNTVNPDGSQTNNGGVGPTTTNAGLLGTAVNEATAPQAAAPTGGYFNPGSQYRTGLVGSLLGFPGASSLVTSALSNDPRIQGPLALAKQGLVQDANGNWTYAPGYAAAQSALKGQEAGASAKATFPYDVVKAAAYRAFSPVVLGPGQTATPNPWIDMMIQKLQGSFGPGGAAAGAGVPPSLHAPLTAGAPLVQRSAAQPAAQGAPQAAAMQVSPAQQADADTEAIQLMQGEMTKAQAALKGATTPAQVAQAQNTIRLLQANIAQQQQRLQTDQAAAAPSSTSAAGPAQLSGLSPGNVAAQKESAEQSADYYWKTAAPAADNAKQQLLNLNQMQATIDSPDSFSPGAGAEVFGKSIGPWLARLPGAPFGKTVASFQDFEKNSTQLATSAARTMGAREPGSVIQMFRSAYPNVNQTQAALQVLISQQKGSAQFDLARQAYLSGQMNAQGGNLTTAVANWNKDATKEGFFYSELAQHYPQAFQAYVGGLSKADRAEVQAKLEALQKLGVE